MISKMLISLAVALIIIGAVYYVITPNRLPFEIRLKRLALFLIVSEISLILVVYTERPTDLLTIFIVFILMTCFNGLFLAAEWIKNNFRKR